MIHLKNLIITNTAILLLVSHYSYNVTIANEYQRSKSKGTASFSSKQSKGKVLEARKNLSSPKNLTKMSKNQTNSLSNSSTPVNHKAHSATYKGRGFGSRENNHNSSNKYHRKLLNQITVDDTQNKGMLYF